MHHFPWLQLPSQGCYWGNLAERGNVISLWIHFFNYQGFGNPIRKIKVVQINLKKTHNANGAPEAQSPVLFLEVLKIQISFFFQHHVDNIFDHVVGNHRSNLFPLLFPRNYEDRGVNCFAPILTHIRVGQRGIWGQECTVTLLSLDVLHILLIFPESKTNKQKTKTHNQTLHLLKRPWATVA